MDSLNEALISNLQLRMALLSASMSSSAAGILLAEVSDTQQEVVIACN